MNLVLSIIHLKLLFVSFACPSYQYTYLNAMELPLNILCNVPFFLAKDQRMWSGVYYSLPVLKLNFEFELFKTRRNFYRKKKVAEI